MVQDSVRRRAQQHSGEAAAAARSHYHQFHVPAGFNQHVDGGTVHDAGLHVQLGVVALQPGHTGVELDADVGKQGLPVHGRRDPRQ
ncbi:hypothetical protein D9M72_456330 [compost metagenome]